MHTFSKLIRSRHLCFNVPAPCLYNLFAQGTFSKCYVSFACKYPVRYIPGIQLHSGNPYAGRINPEVIRCACIGIHGSGGRIQVIALTVQFNPSCGHISLCVKIVPLAVNLLPAGDRIGAVCIAVPPAAVRCCLPGACRWLGIVRDSIAQGSDICFAYCP